MFSSLPRTHWATLSLADLHQTVKAQFDTLRAAPAHVRPFLRTGGVGDVSCATDIGRRPYNEDGVFISNNVLAVADGHGGAETMRRVIRIVERMQPMHVAHSVADLQAHARNTFRQMHEELTELEQSYPARSGSTLTLVTRNKLRRTGDTVFTIANVGDSRAVQVCPLSVQQLTNDHNTNDDVEKMRVNRVRELKDDRLFGSLNVTRAMGDFEFEAAGLTHEPDKVTVLPMHDECAIVIGSDGLYETLNNEQIGVIVRTCLQEAKRRSMTVNVAAILLLLAYETGSFDNLSVIVIANQESDSDAL